MDFCDDEVADLRIYHEDLVEDPELAGEEKPLYKPVEIDGCGLLAICRPEQFKMPRKKASDDSSEKPEDVFLEECYAAADNGAGITERNVVVADCGYGSGEFKAVRILNTAGEVIGLEIQIKVDPYDEYDEEEDDPYDDDDDYGSEFHFVDEPSFSWAY